MVLKVIGAGFGGTDTDAMREALNILGLGPCLDMVEIVSNQRTKQSWQAKLRSEPISWSTLCHGYTSALDWPAAHYWRELMKVYPEAKVILTYRSPEAWFDNFEDTVLSQISATSDPESLGVRIIRNMVFGGNPEDRARVLATYEANVCDVMSEVPRERLLIHGPGDGWESLCQAFDLPIPKQDFPNRNVSEGIKSRVREAQFTAESA